MIIDNEVVTTKRPRGSPKGVQKGPRKIIFVGVALNLEGNIIKKEMIFHSPDEATEENATKVFKEEHGLIPFLSGPFYEVKQTHTGNIKRKEPVTIPLNDVRLTAKRIAGEYNGWNVVGHFVEGYTDTVMLMFGDQIDPTAKKRVPIKGMNLVNVSSLCNIRPLY